MDCIKMQFPHAFFLSHFK